jgi:hypothetical protein
MVTGNWRAGTLTTGGGEGNSLGAGPGSSRDNCQAATQLTALHLCLTAQVLVLLPLSPACTSST